MIRPKSTAPPDQRTEQLVRTYYPYIVRLVQSIVHDAGEAEDIAQETFIAALLTIDNATETVNYKSWLSKIAVNKARDLLRRGKVRSRWQQLWRSQTDGRMPEDIAARNETVQQLWLAVESLNEKHRLPIVLRFVDAQSGSGRRMRLGEAWSASCDRARPRSARGGARGGPAGERIQMLAGL